MKFALAFLSSVAVALAQMTVNTPISPISCVNQQVTFTGGTAPYILQVNPYPPANGQAPLNTYSGITGSPFTWPVEQPANTNVFLRLRDSSGLTAETGQISIVGGGPTTCNFTTASTTPAASTPAGSSTPGSSTPAAGTSSAPAGTTPAASSAAGSTSTTRAATTSSSTGGADSVKIAGASVVAFAGLVAAAVLA